MNDTPEKHEGGCLCGAVRYEIRGRPEWSAHCHCRSCQKALGAAFATWAKVRGENFAVTKGEIALCETSPGVERGFCGTCGTSLTYDAKQQVEGQDWQGDAWFSAATLDDPSIAVPKTHVYVSHQQPWVKLGDGLPTFPEF
jgi:hypothetical protein